VVEKIVLAIDRDNDLGRKAGIASPVIGRDANLNAAIKLAEADPEDSDINTIFGAIKVYDELKQKGEDVEVVTICGDERIGVISDSKIAEQLDEIAQKLGAKSVIVVTDGSEDEFVLPIISSRFRIDGVVRIIVKQSKTIESTYYLIKKMLDDPKIARATLAPLGIILTVYSISLILKNPEWGLGAITLVLGVYFLVKAYGFEESVENYLSTVKQSLMEGRLSFVMYIIALILFIIGIIQGFYNFWMLYNQKVMPGVVTLIVSFIYGSIWWIVASGLSATLGKIFDHILEKKSFKKHITMMFMIVAAGWAFWGASAFLLSKSNVINVGESPLQSLVMSIVAAILISLLGIIPLKIGHEG